MLLVLLKEQLLRGRHHQNRSRDTIPTYAKKSKQFLLLVPTSCTGLPEPWPITMLVPMYSGLWRDPERGWSVRGRGRAKATVGLGHVEFRKQMVKWKEKSVPLGSSCQIIWRLSVWQSADKAMGTWQTLYYSLCICGYMKMSVIHLKTCECSLQHSPTLVTSGMEAEIQGLIHKGLRERWQWISLGCKSLSLTS